MDNATITLIVLAFVAFFFVTELLPLAVTAMAGAIAVGVLGIIASVTRSFCEACDRTRLTAEGTVRSCLFGDDETDLRALLRSGADDAAIADRW